MNLKALLGLTYYTSELDQYLINFDREHPQLSASQRKEKEKFARIYKLRDFPSPDSPNDKLWDEF